MLAFGLLLSLLPGLAWAQEPSLVLVPSREELLLYLQLPEEYAERGALSCSYTLTQGKRSFESEQRFEEAWEAWDLGAVCMLRSSRAFPELEWPSCEPLEVKASFVLGEEQVKLKPQQLSGKASELSSARQLQAVLEAAGYSVSIWEASASFDSHAHRDWELRSSTHEGSTMLELSEGRFERHADGVCTCPCEAAKDGTGGCTICGKTHLVRIREGVEAEAAGPSCAALAPLIRAVIAD